MQFFKSSGRPSSHTALTKCLSSFNCDMHTGTHRTTYTNTKIHKYLHVMNSHSNLNVQKQPPSHFQRKTNSSETCCTDYILVASSFSKYKLAMVNVGGIMQPAPDDKNAKVQIPFFAIQVTPFNVRVLYIIHPAMCSSYMNVAYIRYRSVYPPNVNLVRLTKLLHGSTDHKTFF